MASGKQERSFARQGETFGADQVGLQSDLVPFTTGSGQARMTACLRYVGEILHFVQNDAVLKADIDGGPF